MRQLLKILPVVMSASLVLSACGTSTGDRGLSGGLLGAGTGATIGALAGSAGTGALWGGLGGAAIGMLTSPEMINLGQPVWNSFGFLIVAASQIRTQIRRPYGQE